MVSLYSGSGDVLKNRGPDDRMSQITTADISIRTSHAPSDQYERRPVVWVGVALAQLAHGPLEGDPLVLARFAKGHVEAGHELGSTEVADVPQRHEGGLRAGVEKAAHEAEQLVSAFGDVEAGGASAEGHELARQLELIQVEKAQPRGAELDGREHRVVVAEASMSGEVDEAAGGAVLAEDGFRGLVADEQAGGGQGPGHVRDLADDVRGGLVGNAHDERTLAGGGFRAAKVVDARAGRVADHEVVDERAPPVEQGVKRDVVQEDVGNDDQTACRQPFPHGTDQVRVQVSQMGGGGLTQRLLERAHVAVAEAELRELELQELEFVPHPGGRAHGEDGEIAMSEDGGQQRSPREVELEHGRVERQGGADALEVDASTGLQRRELRIAASGLAQEPQQLRLAPAALPAQRFEVLGRARLASQLGEVNGPVVPVELLAQPMHLLHEAAADPRRRGQRGGPESEQVGQAP